MGPRAAHTLEDAMRSTAGALFLGLFLLGGLSACTRPESETEANRLLVWRMPGDLKSLDPARASWSQKTI